MTTPNLPARIEDAPQPFIGHALCRLRPDLLRLKASTHQMRAGVSVLAGIKATLQDAGSSLRLRDIAIYRLCRERGALEELPRETWESILIRPGDFFQIAAPFYGGGSEGKSPLRTILTVVVAVAAAVAAAYTGGATTTLLGATLSNVAGSLAGAAVMIGGMYLINKIAPLSQQKLSDSAAGQSAQVWSVDGIQNRADLYGMVPLILGAARFAPRYAAQPYTFLRGGDQYARYIFCVGGHNRVSNIRIGDTPIDDFKGVRCIVNENWQGEPFELYPAAIYQEETGITLTGDNGWFTKTTVQNCVELQFEIYFSGGLCHIDKSNNRSARSVAFEGQYRPAGGTDDDWISPFGATPLRSSSTDIMSMDYFSADVNAALPVYLDNENKITFNRAGRRDENGWSGYDQLGNIFSYNGKPVFLPLLAQLEGAAFALDTYSVHPQTGEVGSFFSLSMTAAAGATYTRTTLTVSAATVSAFRRGFSLPLEPGQYEFRLRRLTANFDPDKDTRNTVLDTTVWSVFRSAQSGAVIKYSGAPLTIIQLEIQASEQLNGHVQELNALFESYCPVWNADTEEWEEAVSSNVADVGMLLCTGAHVHRRGKGDPFSMIEPYSWLAFREFCEDYGWRYNAVQSGKQRVREVLHNVLSAGRASVNMSTGKVGVAFDAVDKPSVYPFGPRNSYGFRAAKAFLIEQPHAFRVRFLNETADYQEDERVVYNDGYDHTNATNIVQTEFDGVTDPALIYKHARIRLAESVWRAETFEFNTDFAFLAVAKGDVISLTHDVPLWGVRQARVTGLRYYQYDFGAMSLAALADLAAQHQSEIAPAMSLAEFTAYIAAMSAADLAALLEARGVQDTSRVTAVALDDAVSMDAGKSYGLKCYSSGVSGTVYSIEAESASTNILRLAMPIPAMDAPAAGCLAHFGESGKETHDLVVVAVEPADSMTAKIVAQEYAADKIYAAMSGPVPEWDSGITIPSRWQLGKPAAPVISRITTDEFVLLLLSNGALMPRIQVTYSIEARPDVEVASIHVQVRQKDGEDEWRDAGQASGVSGVIFAENVEEQITYELRLYALSASGVSSDFSLVHDAYVVGRTTRPPAPTAIHIDGSRIWWEMPADYPIDVRGWEVFMGFDASEPFDYALRISSPHASAMEFDIERWSGWSRRVWVRTVDDVGLASDPVSVVINMGDALVDNVVLEIFENAQRHWPGKIINGGIVNDYLAPSSSSAFWFGPVWQRDDFWQSGATLAMTYETELSVPSEALYSYLSVRVDIPEGVLASAEYRLDGMNAYAPMPDKIYVDSELTILLRVKTSAGSAGVIREIAWTFDVPDQMETINNVAIPAGGARLLLRESFRWISNIVFGLEGQAGSLAAQAVWVDKGIIADGFVTEGPLVEIRDSAGASVSGIVDVTIQGAKGV